MTTETDVAVIGAGIVGLAHAWAAARQGLRVSVFERTPQAQGASIRNFGMIWPIGQAPGEMFTLALDARRRWLDISEQARIWLSPCGSLHLAYAEDEWAVLEEFASKARDWGYDCQLLSSGEVTERWEAVQPEQLRGGLYSSTECCVDPRQAIAQIPLYLAEKYDVRFHFATTVTEVASPWVHTSCGQSCRADRILICSGSDFDTLFPEIFRVTGIRRCKLQMMRTVPQPGGWRIGPHLAGGLTLCHYVAFQKCPSLSALRQRLEQTMPEYLRQGIHVMAAQNHLGEVVIGDSHEYDDEISIFDKQEIDERILTYLRQLVRLPDWTLQARWHGIYAKHPTLPIVTARPQPGVVIRVAPGGTGMTLSFAFADRFWQGESSLPR